jgi:hypothetical protein
MSKDKSYKEGLHIGTYLEWNEPLFEDLMKCIYEL